MIVVDTNVIAYLWIPGEYSEASERALQRDPEWVVPLLWRSEFRNVVAGYVQRGKMPLDTAVQLAEEAESFFRGREYSVPSAKVLDLAAKSFCSAYDCEFVTLAKDLNVLLVTTDTKLIKAFPEVSVSLPHFVS